MNSSTTHNRESSARPRGYRDGHDHNITPHKAQRKRSRSRSQSPPHRNSQKYKSENGHHDAASDGSSDRHARHGSRRDEANTDEPDNNRTKSSRVDADEERRARMAKLRADNDEEERRLEADAVEANNEKASKEELTKIKEFTQEDLEGLTEEEKMMKMMGIEGFSTTKGKAVKDNQVGASRGAAAKSKARKYRQYMNRKGGFNRALDKMN